MNNDEIQSLIRQLKANDLTDDEIMDVFFEAFKSGEMDRKDLETLAGVMGYELTDDFKNDATPDPIDSKGAEGLSKEDLEDAKEIDEGESKEEFKEKIDDAAKVEDVAEDEEKGEDDSESEDEDSSDDKDDEEDEDKDWDDAQKLFKI